MGRTALKAIQAAAGVGGGDFYPYTIDNSLRIAGSNQYFTRTLSTTSNRKTWTLSLWAKDLNSTYANFFAAGGGTGYNGTSCVNYNDELFFATNDGPSAPWEYVGFNDKFRDPSSWYHIVFQLDTTNATSTERQKVWVNGRRLSDMRYTNYIAQNRDGYINNSSYTQYIGSGGNPNYANKGCDAYIADMIFIDGQALDPTYFAETKNNVWIPKDPSAQSYNYGTNGFWLNFADSADLGKDVSGNNNHWTKGSGINSDDQMLDTPTLNYPTLQAGFSTSATTYSEGNLVAQQDSAAGKHTRASFALPTTGKWYWEVQFIDARSFDPPTTAFGIGVSDDDGIGDYGYTKGAIFGAVPASTTLYAYQDSGYTPGNNITLSNAVVDGDWFGIAYDADTRKVWLWSQRDNAWLASGNPSAGTNPWKTLTALSAGQDYFPILMTQTNDSGRWSKFGVNFGQQSFVGTAPTDFLQLNATNLSEPTIGPNSATQSDDHFDTLLYNIVSPQAVTGLEFQPDFVWIKNRSLAYYHGLYDAVRGAPNSLYSNSTDGENTYSANQKLASFDSNGFTVDSTTSTNVLIGNCVAWNWKGNGSGSSNTDGSITSTVSANTAAGVSIVTYTGNGTNGATVGHGLGVTPHVFIVKRRDAAASWQMYNTSFGGAIYFMDFHDPYQLQSSTNRWNSTAPTSSVFSLGTNTNVNASSGTYVTYCFAEVEGFSKFGSYTGNGSTDGPFIYTGFRPAWVMVKKTNAANDWGIWDSARDTYNVSQRTLFVDLANAESNGNYLVDFLSNGFKLKNDVGISNDNGGSYIFMAFAENPFKYSNAR